MLAMWYIGQQFSKPPCSSLAPPGPSGPATTAPRSGQDRGRTTTSADGQPGPSTSEAEAPQLPPLGHELERSADVEQPGAINGHSHEHEKETNPLKNGTSSATASMPGDSLVLPQMQQADLQNVQQVRIYLLTADCTLSGPHLEPT